MAFKREFKEFLNHWRIHIVGEIPFHLDSWRHKVALCVQEGMTVLEFRKKTHRLLSGGSPPNGRTLKRMVDLGFVEVREFSRKQELWADLSERFEKVCSYDVIKQAPIHVNWEGSSLLDKLGVVYVRVLDGESVYVGSTNGKLEARLKAHLRIIPNYKNPKDLAYRKAAEGKNISIFAVKPRATKIMGFEVTTHRGLEVALIDYLKPLYVSRK